jgi:hypothetical protein
MALLRRFPGSQSNYSGVAILFTESAAYAGTKHGMKLGGGK